MSFDLSSILRSLPDVQPKLRMYVGNLKNGNFFNSLENFHFLLKDCDKEGKVTKRNKDVMVQFHPIKADKTLDYLLLCCACLDKSALDAKSEIYQGVIEKEFLLEERQSYCIHCQAVEKFKPCDYFPVDNYQFPFKLGNDFITIQELYKVPFLCAEYANGCYGLLRRPRKNLKCISPICKEVWNCCHIDAWNTHERQDLVNTPSSKEADLDLEFVALEDLAAPTKLRTSESKRHEQNPLKIDIPLTHEIQERFRQLAKEGYQYADKSVFSPTYVDGLCCTLHSNSYKKTATLMSKEVLIFGSNWIEKRNRCIYYR